MRNDELMREEAMVGLVPHRLRVVPHVAAPVLPSESPYPPSGRVRGLTFPIQMESHEPKEL